MDLERDLYFLANRELIAKALGELYYEEVLAAIEVRSGEYELKLQSGVSYQFKAQKNIWTALTVVPESILRQGEGGKLSSAQFFIDAQTELGMDDIVLANFLEEMNNTLKRDVIILTKKQSTSASTALEMSEEDRQSLLSGHPKILLNKGRIGWSEADADAYSPESGRTFKLHWVALKKNLAISYLADHLTTQDLLAESMDERELTRLMNLIQHLGASESEYCYLPVHPWQWQRFIKTQFAFELADRSLIDLGVFGDDYRAQISLRTLTNVSRPGKLDIKLPLTILNTSAIRGLPSKYIKAGPQLSTLVADLCQSDEYLRASGMDVIKERAGISYTSEHFAQIASAPYRYHEYLGATWRENAQAKVNHPQSQAMMTGSLFYVDAQKQSLLGKLIAKSELSAREWLARYFRHVVLPLYHLQLRHGLGLVSHGQNIVLKLTNSAPAGVFIKDFGGDLRLNENFKERYRDHECMQALTTLPAHYLIHDLYTGHFITVLRYLSSIMRDCEGLPEIDFYALLAREVSHYHQQYPELLASSSVNLLAPKFQRVLINRVRFKIGYGDSSARPVPELGRDLDNPLYLGWQKNQEGQ